MSGRSSENLLLPAEEFTTNLLDEIDSYIDEHGLAESRLEPELIADQMRKRLFTRVYKGTVGPDIAQEMVIGADRLEVPQIVVHLLKQSEAEAKHGRMLSQRLWNLSGDPQGTFTRAVDSSKELWENFRGQGIAETAAMLQYGAEQMAQYRHEKEREYYDDETAEVYENVISPEEQFHAKIGVNVLRTLCATEQTQRTALQTSREGRQLITSKHDGGIRNAYGGNSQ